MKKKSQIIDLCRTIVSDFFPSELFVYDMYAEDNFTKLENGEDILQDNKQSNGEFEAGNSLSEVLNFLSLLKATYQTISLTEQEGIVNIDLSNVFTQELQKAGLRKNVSVEISLKYSETIVNHTGKSKANNLDLGDLTSKAKDLLAKAEIDAVFEIVQKMSLSDETRDEFILIQAQYKNVKNQYSKGLSDNIEYNQSLNQIRNSILSIINSIESNKQT